LLALTLAAFSAEPLRLGEARQYFRGKFFVVITLQSSTGHRTTISLSTWMIRIRGVRQAEQKVCLHCSTLGFTTSPGELSLKAFVHKTQEVVGLLVSMIQGCQRMA
jgi:hypothetical protein